MKVNAKHCLYWTLKQTQRRRATTKYRKWREMLTVVRKRISAERELLSRHYFSCSLSTELTVRGIGTDESREKTDSGQSLMCSFNGKGVQHLDSQHTKSKGICTWVAGLTQTEPKTEPPSESQVKIENCLVTISTSTIAVPGNMWANIAKRRIE